METGAGRGRGLEGVETGTGGSAAGKGEGRLLTCTCSHIVLYYWSFPIDCSQAPHTDCLLMRRYNENKDAIISTIQ